MVTRYHTQAVTAETADDGQGTSLIRIEHQDLMHVDRWMIYWGMEVRSAYQNQSSTE